MADGILKIKKPWVSKPPYRVGVDKGNSLSRGIVEMYDFRLNAAFQSLFGRTITPATAVSSGFIVPSINTAGQEVTIVDTGSSSNMVLDSFYSSGDPFTYMIGFRPDVTPSGVEHIFNVNGATNSTLRYTTSGTVLEMLVNPLTGSDRVSHTMTSTAGTSLIAGGSWGGSGAKIKVISKTDAEGMQITESASAGTGTYTTGAHNLGNNDVDGGFLWAVFWNRQLSDDETKSFLGNPWQVLQPQTIRFPVASSAAAASALLLLDS